MKTVITIGRQNGSGGSEIGRKIAEKLNVPCFDKETFFKTAKEKGFEDRAISNHIDRANASFLYNIVMSTYAYNVENGYAEGPMSQKVFLAQFDTVKEAAEKGSCVIVGRAADYALRDNPNCLNIFIYGKEGARAKRISEKQNVSANEARELCRQVDKQRQSYYNFYSDKKWGRADTYDLCLDSGKLGIDGTVALILDYIQRLEGLTE